jgi:exodeoxyribonuclease VII large subunit
VISTNEWNYAFSLQLFSATLQGDNAVYTITEQLKEIKRLKNNFDVFVIVRGGSADIGLSCYNNYNLAKEIAIFPIPVLTGIGHSTNETVCEMISYDNAITPTKLAEYLIQHFHNFSNTVNDAEKIFNNFSADLISA